MKQTTNMQRSISYLNKIFKALNEEYFDNELPTPIITIQSTPKAYGHFTPWEAYRIKDQNGDIVAGAVEINIGAGTLDRPIENVVATFLHELIHFFCYIRRSNASTEKEARQFKETSRSGQYHNSRFRAEAEKRALKIDYDSRIGWSITSPTEELIDFIISYGFSDIQLGRNEFESFFIGGGAKTGNGGTSIPTPPKKKKGNSIKMICPSCNNIARVTKQTNLICGDCMEHMIEA